MMNYKLLFTLLIMPLVFNASGCNDNHSDATKDTPTKNSDNTKAPDVISEILNRPSSPSTKSVSDHVDTIFGEVDTLDFEVKE